MSGKQLRLMAISNVSKKVFKNGAARLELILSLALTSTLLYGMLVSLTSIAI